jgi:hypothetical protein
MNTHAFLIVAKVVSAAPFTCILGRILLACPRLGEKHRDPLHQESGGRRVISLVGCWEIGVYRSERRAMTAWERLSLRMS